MKLTVDEIFPTWFATLEGHRVRYAQEADDEAGTVKAPLVNEAGKLVFDHERDDFAVVQRTGKVEITLRKVAAEEIAEPVDADNPFRVEKARPGELSEDYSRPFSGPAEPHGFR